MSVGELLVDDQAMDCAFADFSPPFPSEWLTSQMTVVNVEIDTEPLANVDALKGNIVLLSPRPDRVAVQIEGSAQVSSATTTPETADKPKETPQLEASVWTKVVERASEAGAAAVIIASDDNVDMTAGTAKLTTLNGRAEIGEDGLSFEPKGGFPTVMLKTVNDKPLKLTSGKWYYEVTILSEQVGYPQFGWADENFAATPNTGVGDDAHSWGIDGDRVRAWHGGEFKAFGHEWEAGAVIGCMADLDRKTISFSLNGSTAKPHGIAFKDIAFIGGLQPALTASAGSYHRKPQVKKAAQ